MNVVFSMFYRVGIFLLGVLSGWNFVVGGFFSRLKFVSRCFIALEFCCWDFVTFVFCL